MPWCEPCKRFYNPNSVNVDGTCPECATPLAEPMQTAWVDDRQKAPWHFWLLLGALAIYLGWRMVQLILLVVN